MSQIQSFLSLLFQFIKDWLPLWIAILVFLLNAFNQNLKSYREIKKEARIYFLKHRMLLEPLGEALGFYREIIELNKERFQEIIGGFRIKDMSLETHKDYNEERVIGYCVYNRKGTEKKLFQQYVEMKNKYDLLIWQCAKLEESLDVFLPSQGENTDTLNNLYMNFATMAENKAFTLETNNEINSHPLSERIAAFIKVDLKDYLLEFIMPNVNFALFRENFINPINNLYTEFLKEGANDSIKQDTLKEKIVEIEEQLKKCDPTEDYWLNNHMPISYVQETYHSLIEIMNQIDNSPFKGHRFYAWIERR